MQSYIHTLINDRHTSIADVVVVQDNAKILPEQFFIFPRDFGPISDDEGTRRIANNKKDTDSKGFRPGLEENGIFSLRDGSGGARVKNMIHRTRSDNGMRRVGRQAKQLLQLSRSLPKRRNSMSQNSLRKLPKSRNWEEFSDSELTAPVRRTSGEISAEFKKWEESNESLQKAKDSRLMAPMRRTPK
jgi:hypothetical protein